MKMMQQQIYIQLNGLNIFFSNPPNTSLPIIVATKAPNINTNIGLFKGRIKLKNKPGKNYKNS